MSLIQPSYMQCIFLELILKFLHITLHVSTNNGHHQAFNIVDENCCASILLFQYLMCSSTYALVYSTVLGSSSYCVVCLYYMNLPLEIM
jgi:hypothetical protein